MRKKKLIFSAPHSLQKSHEKHAVKISLSGVHFFFRSDNFVRLQIVNKCRLEKRRQTFSAVCKMPNHAVAHKVQDNLPPTPSCKSISCHFAYYVPPSQVLVPRQPERRECTLHFE